MKRLCAFVAHPYGGLNTNILLARNFIRGLHLRWPDIVCVATWIIEAQIYDDDNEVQRNASIARNLAVIERCDAFVGCGAKWSIGMCVERDHALECSIPVVDLVGKQWRALNTRVARFAELVEASRV